MAKFAYDSQIEEFILQKEFYFEWDEGNSEKSNAKHGISSSEAEEVFFDERFLSLGLQIDPKAEETRYGIIGTTWGLKILFVSFTVRASKIRVISARKANKRERRIYEKS